MLQPVNAKCFSIENCTVGILCPVGVWLEALFLSSSHGCEHSISAILRISDSAGTMK